MTDLICTIEDHDILASSDWILKMASQKTEDYVSYSWADTSNPKQPVAWAMCYLLSNNLICITRYHYNDEYQCGYFYCMTSLGRKYLASQKV